MPKDNVSIDEVKKAFHVANDLDALVLKHLVFWLLFVVEIDHITKAAAPTAGNTYP